jgi:hypothetical protein
MGHRLIGHFRGERWPGHFPKYVHQRPKPISLYGGDIRIERSNFF